jgi:hypothetical protein
LIGIRRVVAVCVIMATASAGCFGPPSQPPPGPSYYTTFEGGSGYRDILSYLNTTGPFPVRAVIDADLKMVYVGYSDNVIHWWNFSNEGALSSGTWPAKNWTCVWRGMEMLANHTLATGCGEEVSLLRQNGSLLATVAFSGNLSGFAIAAAATLVVAGVETPPAIEIRNLLDGTLVAHFPIARTAWQVYTDARAHLVGMVDGGTVEWSDLVNGINRSLSDGGVYIPPSGSQIWAILNGGSDDNHTTSDDTLRVYISPAQQNEVTTVVLENGSAASPLGFAQYDLYGSEDGREAAYYTVRGDYSYSNVSLSTRAGTDIRNFIYVYNTSGALVRGMTVPGQEIYVKLMANGSLYTVSGARLPVGGSQLWLSYGVPDCAPPVLVKHNITA